MSDYVHNVTEVFVAEQCGILIFALPFINEICDFFDKENTFRDCYY